MKNDRLVALVVLVAVLALAGLMRAAEESKPAENRVAWHTNLKEALAIARKEKKVLLLDFTGSDWCGWCMKLDKETYSTAEFAALVKDKAVLVTVDFPQSKPQSEEIKKQNAALQEKYKIEGFPNAVFVTTDGKELGRIDGYQPKDEWLKSAADILAKAK